jgi:hypothetical protein
MGETEHRHGEDERDPKAVAHVAGHGLQVHARAVAHLVRHGVGVGSGCRGLAVLGMGRPHDRLRAMGLVSDVFRMPEMGSRGTRGQRHDRGGGIPGSHTWRGCRSPAQW